MKNIRFETQLAPQRAEPYKAMAQELGLTSSQLVQKALHAYFEIYLQAKKGHALVYQKANGDVAGELRTPEIAFLEWFRHKSQRITLADSAFKKAVDVLTDETEPTQALKDLMKES